jgi:hypothetical protein
MPEPSLDSQPLPVPVSIPPSENKPHSNVKFYLVCAIALGLLATSYAYITKYRETKVTLDKKETSLLVSESSRHEITAKFSDYKNSMESKTSYIKKPYMFNGALVMDGHGNATYVKIYLKDKKLVSVGNSTSFNELSQTVTVTQAVTVHSREERKDVSGSKSNGVAYVSIPVDVFTGELTRIGAGFDHNFLFGSSIGVDGGTTNFTDPIGGAFLNLHLGFQIP